jgi:hypothetical protein
VEEEDDRLLTLHPAQLKAGLFGRCSSREQLVSRCAVPGLAVAV